MQCDRAREAASARLDGEDAGIGDEEIDRHLATCASCRSWLDGAAAVSRLASMRSVKDTQDLSTSVVRGLEARASGPSRAGLRWALVGSALLQLALAVPAVVFGDHSHGGPHVAREVGTAEIALAVGIIAAAWRPWRAAGMLPLVSALAVGLLATSTVDLVRGATSLVREMPHLLAVLEAVLLWRLRHGNGQSPPATPQVERLRRVA